jgi:hypothetical protein
MQNFAHARHCRVNPQQTEHEILSALSACVRLSQAGCNILAAHVHGGLPGVIVDRRPDIPGLTPGSLYADSSGAYYIARLGNVGVSWTEARRARS